MNLLGPIKTDCPDGCGKFGTPLRGTGHVRDCPCEPCSKGWGQTKPRKRIRQRSAKRESTADDGWAEARAEALDRTGGSCEIETPWCEPGPHPAVHVHHRLPRSAGGTHDQSNLLTLCERAHLWTHQHPTLSYEQGWLISRYT